MTVQWYYFTSLSKVKKSQFLYIPLSYPLLIILTISTIYIQNHVRQCFNKQFRKSTRRNSIILTNIFAYHVLISFLIFQGSFSNHFLSVQITCFNHSFRVGHVGCIIYSPQWYTRVPSNFFTSPPYLLFSESFFFFSNYHNGCEMIYYCNFGLLFSND